MISNLSSNHRNRRLSWLRATAVLVLFSAAAVMAVFAASPPTSGSAKTTPVNGVYIVQMAASPVVSYTGDIAGYKATKPKQGQKIDPLSQDVVRYADYLKAKHDETLQKVGGGAKIYDYAVSYNGFAAKVTPEQAAALAKQQDVLAVSPDETVYADTFSTPHFLGLDAAGGLWDQLGGTGSKKMTGAGEGIIIGVIDTGIWPESKSFSDRDAKGNLAYQQIPGFHGKCEGAGGVGGGTPADGSWNAGLCNQKLIAAQHFNAAWGGDAGIKALFPWEFLSPRDFGGHGTHTTSTAGGNKGVQPDGAFASLGAMSGMAPRARVAMYKALWQTQTTGSGRTSDLVAAINQAVSDGVDVINYSISGSQTNFLDPVEVAFLFATDAGVFVATSAGNSGPTDSTVAHPGPWLTTVAASTKEQSGIGKATLGNGDVYSGAAAAGTAAGPVPLVNSTDAGLSGANADAVRLCYSSSWPESAGSPALDPTKVSGKIVVCERGTNDRVDKSKAVKEAGGIGMILVNVSAATDSIVADMHSVPTVHLRAADRTAVETYAGTAGAIATLSVEAANPPQTADFSSRGPLLAGAGDLLKPDMIAPGVDILAAVAPPGNGGQNFSLYSGTSMSSPHVAGVAALLKQLRPTWTPMMIKSALMTTGYDVLDPSITDATRTFRQGAGHIEPNLAADPGLVYTNGFNDWLAFLCGTGRLTASYCPSIKIDPSNLNVPSIAIGDLGGIQTVKRTVTNVGSTTAIYTASTTGLVGITTSITPSSLTLSPGQKASYTVRFERTTAAVNIYAGGQLIWTDGTHNVRIPVVIRPVALAAPASVSGTGNPINYNVTFGYTGPFEATARGMVPATLFPGLVENEKTVSFDVVVPAGTTHARFSLFNQFTDGADDLDLEVYRGSTLVGSSGGSTTDEEVNLVNPVADTYKVSVVGYATEGPDANFTLFSWVLGSTDAGNMTVTAPATAATGGKGNIQLSFSSLASGTKYLGSVAYTSGGDATGMPNPTIVRVDKQ